MERTEAGGRDEMLMTAIVPPPLLGPDAERVYALLLHRRRAEAAVREMVMLNLAEEALAMPLGDRLSLGHFALMASVSPLALAVGSRAVTS